MRGVQNSCSRDGYAVSIEIGRISLRDIGGGERARVGRRVLERGGSKLVLRRGACHGKMGKLEHARSAQGIPFAVLRLKTGRKGSNFHQARGFPHWNARKLRGVLILRGNLGAQKIGLGIG
jgi:hypothetical protein